MQASGEIRERVRCHQIRSTCLLRLARREAAVAEGHPGRLRHGAGATEPCADVSFVPEEEGRRADGSQQPAGYLMAKEWLGPDPPPPPSSSARVVGPRHGSWRSELPHPRHRSPLVRLLRAATPHRVPGAAPSWRPSSLSPHIWICRATRSEGVCVRERLQSESK
jgi:hypothetical protein